MHPHILYAQHLMAQGHGYGLYEPDPASMYDRVRVGDVGHISNGSFKPVFNILYLENDAVNINGVPAYFEAHPEWRENRHTQRRTPIPAGSMYSSYVHSCGGNLQISG